MPVILLLLGTMLGARFVLAVVSGQATRESRSQ